MTDKTILEAAKVISYNPDTGEISRHDRKNSGGSIDKDGYLIIKIKRRQFKAHRLAWVKIYGVAPTYNIDHINRNRLDNRISNLRDVPQKINNQNTVGKINADTGYIGISLDRTTNGLLAKFTTRLRGKAYRFRAVNDAVSFRKNSGLEV